jgi:hypothetical protein
MTDAKMANIQRNYASHVLDRQQNERTVAIRAEAQHLAVLIADMVPEGREQSLALTKLEEVMFWANAGIARP